MKSYRFTSLLFFVALTLHAEEYQFDVATLSQNISKEDKEYLLKGKSKPGRYDVDIYINSQYIESRKMLFMRASNDSNRLTPCLAEKDISKWGLKSDVFTTDSQGKCKNILANPLVKMSLDLNNSKVDFSIPQQLLMTRYTDISPIALWDDGINALVMNYSLGATENDSKINQATRSRSAWGQFTPGINLGAWRVRNNSTWQHTDRAGSTWKSNATYIERGINTWKSRLVIGQRDTSGDVFDSLPFTGLMIATDENMVPFSQRQFSPLVRGIARTSARVEIKQNGYSIYTTTVPPGPFEINTITEAQDGGDLEVIVWEADGKPQVFTVPYQKPAIALHRGFIKYSVMSGRYHPADFHSQDEVTQATLMVGLPWNLTLFGGGQASRSYQSGAMGVGLSLAALGSVSVDGTQAQRHMINQGSQLGNKWRLRYSNTFAATHTQISASVSQYSARFSELAEVLNSYGNRADGLWQQHYRQHKSSQILQLSQSVGTWGAFSASLQHDQWQNQRSSNNYRLSWSQSFRRFSLSADWQRNLNGFQRQQSGHNDTFSVRVMVPLDQWLGNSVQVTSDVNSAAKGRQKYDVGISGQSFDRQMTWALRTDYARSESQRHQINHLASAEWAGTYGKLGGSYSYSDQYRTMSASLNGGLIIHHRGITFGQPFTDSVVLAETPGVKGVKVGGWPGIRTDYRGFTLLPYLSNYQNNIVKVDTASLSSTAELLQSEGHAIPSQGSVIEMRFKTRVGARAILTITTAQGEPLPLGAQLYLPDQQGSVGMVGDSGEAYVSGLAPQGVVKVESPNRNCVIHYKLPNSVPASGVYTMPVRCQ